MQPDRSYHSAGLVTTGFAEYCPRPRLEIVSSLSPSEHDRLRCTTKHANSSRLICIRFWPPGDQLCLLPELSSGVFVSNGGMNLCGNLQSNSPFVLVEVGCPTTCLATGKYHVMNNDEKSFLSLRILPARLNPEQAAWYVGCHVESIPVLIAAGLLKPLGRPAPNASKFFALAELEVLRADTKWLARATEAIQNWHRNKNDRHRGMRPASSSAGCPGRKVSGTIRSAERFAAPANQTESANGTHDQE